MNPKHHEWFAIERGHDLRREAAGSHLLAQARESATERRRGVLVGRSARTWLRASLVALRGIRPTPRLEPPTTHTP